MYFITFGLPLYLNSNLLNMLINLVTSHKPPHSSLVWFGHVLAAVAGVAAAAGAFVDDDISFKDGPTILTLIDLDPPTDLPNKDACCANALAPG